MGKGLRGVRLLASWHLDWVRRSLDLGWLDLATRNLVLAERHLRAMPAGSESRKWCRLWLSLVVRLAVIRNEQRGAAARLAARLAASAPKWRRLAATVRLRDPKGGR